MPLHLEIPIGGLVKKSRAECVCLSVCLCVQAFWHVVPKRVDRSGQGWHCSVHQSGGTMMVPVSGRLVPRATWRRSNLCTKSFVRATGQTASDTGVPSAGHMTPTVNHDPLWFPSPRGARRTCEGPEENVFGKGSSGSSKH